MRTDEIKRMIQEAVADEKRTNRLHNFLQETARNRGKKLDDESISGIVNVIQEYIEHVPLFLEQGEKAAKQMGLEKEVGQMLQELENYWFNAEDLIPDYLGLMGLVDDAYASLFLLQNLSDYCQATFGKPLLQQNFTAANQGIRALIDAQVVATIEQRVDITLSNAMMPSILEQLNRCEFSCFDISDPIWSKSSSDEVVNARLEAIGVITEPIGEGEGSENDELGFEFEYEDSDELGIEPDYEEDDELGFEPEPPPSTSETRYLNAQIRDHQKEEPLQVEKNYLLEFGVDLKASGEVYTVLPEESKLFDQGEDLIELTIQVESEDFEIMQHSQTLMLPRTGQSKGKARFDIIPKHEGRGTLTATVHKMGNFILQMDITYSIGTSVSEPIREVTRGRMISSASSLKPRDITMVINPSPAGGYDCTVIKCNATRVKLSITEREVEDIINTARDSLMQVIKQRDAESTKLVFQAGLKIDEASAEKALHTLARAGALLFQRIFFGPSANRNVQELGNKLRELAIEAINSKERLKLQVVAERFPIPWGLIYVGEVQKDENLGWDNFLGMCSIIDNIPLTNSFVDDLVIKSDNPLLNVSVNVNSDIDQKMKNNVVARQLEYWNNYADKLESHIRLEQHKSSDEFLEALRSGTDQIMYIYCHAVTSGPRDRGGIHSSCLILSNNSRLTLSDLSLDAPTTMPLKGKPLVFINACESAELSPAFYDGFVPYFMARGARGVIGTECKTPALFATEWALRFFERFLAGEVLGELFLDLRREFCTTYNNPLGLLYAVYCDGDTCVKPGLQFTEI